MAVYISTTTDAFAERFKEARRDRPKQDNIRRPLRGIQVKPNTYACIRAKKASGGDIPLFDSGSNKFSEKEGIGRSTSYANFLINGISEQRAEKQQIIETFGEDYVYFFGERPRFLDVRGMLINTADFNWKSEFWTNYDQYLRGTKLVEQNARMYLYFDDVVVEGYIVSASTSADASQPHLLPFNFSMFVTTYAILSKVGSVYIEKSDRGAKAIKATGIDPSVNNKMLVGKDVGPSAGGLNSFLTKANQYVNDATFSIQSTLETIKNTFYGTELVVPDGIGTMVVTPIIENKMKWVEPPQHVAIHKMVDEYVERDPEELSAKVKAASVTEEARITKDLFKMSLEGAEILEAEARAAFEKAGIDTGKPSVMMSILGRGAFAVVQYVAPFGIAKVGGGKIGQADQVSGALLR